MFIWTETPLIEIWGHLRYLSAPHNVYNVLTGKTFSLRMDKWAESGSTTQAAGEIAACVRQADEYYAAANEVSLVTKPLLQFYGASCLAKGVILASDQGKTLHDLRYHGLSTRATSAANTQVATLQEYTNTPDVWEIENEFAIMNEGIFPLLCRSVDQPLPDFGTVFRLKETIGCVPDLSVRFYRHYSEYSRCFYLVSEPEVDKSGHLAFEFSSREDVDKILLEVPGLVSDFARYAHRFVSKELMVGLPIYLGRERGTVAGEYLVSRPSPKALYKSLPVLFLGMHILSNLVRYKPRFWMNVLDGKKTGSFALLEAFCNIANRRLTNDVLEAIWNEKFVYATPAYFS